jgi:hypothetical protein
LGLKEQIDHITMIVGDFNTPLSPIEMPSTLRKKSTKKMQN